MAGDWLEVRSPYSGEVIRTVEEVTGKKVPLKEGYEAAGVRVVPHAIVRRGAHRAWVVEATSRTPLGNLAPRRNARRHRGTGRS